MRSPGRRAEWSLRAPLAFAVSLAVGAALTPLAGMLARRWGALDHALSSRKIHGRPVPRTGGIAIVAAFFLPVLWVLAGGGTTGDLSRDARLRALGLLLGGILIAGLGVYDDLHGAGARLKLSVQFAAAALVYALGYRVDELSLPFLEHLRLGWLGLPLTVVWIVGVVNAVNLIDGLDGLAAGLGLVAVVATALVASQGGHPLTVFLMAALGGAILAFLFFNLNPASIFMGDTGSMFIGFVLAAASLRAHQRPCGAVALLVPFVLLGIPIADTLLAIARRAARGAPIFAADREHLHHKLLALGLSPRRAALAMWLAAALLGGIAAALTRAGPWRAVAYLAGLGALGLLVLWRLGYVTRERLRTLATRRSRNLELLGDVRDIGDQLRQTAGAIEIWHSVKELAPRLGAHAVALQLVDKEETVDFRRKVESGATGLRTNHSLRAERLHAGHLELLWADDRTGIDRDTEIAVELLCGHVMSAVRRLETGPLAPTSDEPASSGDRRRARRASRASRSTGSTSGPRA